MYKTALLILYLSLTSLWLSMGEFHNLLTFPKTGWEVSIKLYTVLVPKLVTPVPVLPLPTRLLLLSSASEKFASPSLKYSYILRYMCSPDYLVDITAYYTAAVVYTKISQWYVLVEP